VCRLSARGFGEVERVDHRSFIGHPISKIFNNHVGFERGLWRRKMGQGGRVPKTSDIGEKLGPPNVVFLVAEYS